MNKKQLYESIIRNVAREVKKTLDEGTANLIDFGNDKIQKRQKITDDQPIYDYDEMCHAINMMTDMFDQADWWDDVDEGVIWQVSKGVYDEDREIWLTDKEYQEWKDIVELGESGLGGCWEEVEHGFEQIDSLISIL